MQRCDHFVYIYRPGRFGCIIRPSQNPIVTLDELDVHFSPDVTPSDNPLCWCMELEQTAYFPNFRATDEQVTTAFLYARRIVTIEHVLSATNLFVEQTIKSIFGSREVYDDIRAGLIDNTPEVTLKLQYVYETIRWARKREQEVVALLGKSINPYTDYQEKVRDERLYKRFSV